MQRQIVLDTETTGLTPAQGHRIIEIGGVEIINRKLTGKHFHCYINPERDIDEGALDIHGITRDFLKDKPVFSQIREDFLNFIHTDALIIHNAAFDIGFIDHELKLCDSHTASITDKRQIIDTLAVAKARHPGQKNNLDALCKRYAVDNTQRNLHGALLDANLLAQVYLAMTGGQGSLFGDDTLMYKPKTPRIETQIRLPLRVIKATPGEEALHLARLKEVEEIARRS